MEVINQGFGPVECLRVGVFCSLGSLETLDQSNLIPTEPFLQVSGYRFENMHPAVPSRANIKAAKRLHRFQPLILVGDSGRKDGDIPAIIFFFNVLSLTIAFPIFLPLLAKGNLRTVSKKKMK